MSTDGTPVERWPEFDDRVHVWMSGLGCCPGTVDSRITDAPADGSVHALQIKTDQRVGDCTHRLASVYDPKMQASGSWHWPHDHELPKAPSLNIEALARLDLRPDEILAVTLGRPDLKPSQLSEFGEFLTEWLADHGQPVAGVLVLPQGSGLAAVRAPEPVTHEQVERGEKSLNDYRRYLGMQPLADDAPTEPQPDTTAPITINVHVEGSLLSEKKLQDVIVSQLGRVAAMRGLRW